MKDSSIRKSNTKSYQKKKPAKNNLSESNFKTPIRQKKIYENSSPFLLSKINIEKKQKLKGFVDRKTFNLFNTTSQNLNNVHKNEIIEDLFVDSIQPPKTAEKK